MKKYKVFFAVAIIILIALSACGSNDLQKNYEDGYNAALTQVAPTAQFEAPEFAPTAEALEQYSVIPAQTATFAVSQFQSDYNNQLCSLGKSENPDLISVWDNEGLNGYSIEYIGIIDPDIEPMGQGFLINEDRGMIRILVTPTTLKLSCIMAEVSIKAVENGLYFFNKGDNGINYYAYLRIFSGGVEIFNYFDILKLKIDPTTRNLGTATPSP